MLSKINSCAVIGLDCENVEVEVDISPGLGNIVVVGLPDTAVQESKERVKSAIKNSGVNYPTTRITINLAPADIKKEGPAYDLPIAVGILAASRQIEADLSGSLFVGELALDGKLRHTNGILPITIYAQEKKYQRIFVPKVDEFEAGLVEGIEIIPIENLIQLISFLEGKEKIEPARTLGLGKVNEKPKYSIDMSFIKGQEHVKRALEIAASGGHNVLMSGPPGTGKTLLARAVPTILPQMTKEEALEVTKIYSIAGLLPSDKPLITTRPFRTPHHSASAPALVGGGAFPRPGEISLSHRGVLFLDELPEFPRTILENLRQPLEDGVVTISRAQGTLTFPANFTLVASMNPCPCGYLNDPEHDCSCSPSQIIKYQKKISGPLLDRIDLYIEVPRIKFDKLSNEELEESSDEIRQRVESARVMQKERFRKSGLISNSEMNSQVVKEFCQVDEATLNLLKTAVSQFNLSARSYYKILKVARTIADLERKERIESKHIAEALQYRPRHNTI
ncbi:MAG: YifB family Mg chelatase-like AAA ATPase [Candidatus Pacebacteria bacterium]|nr:YifB family Mg chelatase-like AAA ATPase [Candidatus Paceibacterota bacterium]